MSALDRLTRIRWDGFGSTGPWLRGLPLLTWVIEDEYRPAMRDALSSTSGFWERLGITFDPEAGDLEP